MRLIANPAAVPYKVSHETDERTLKRDCFSNRHALQCSSTLGRLKDSPDLRCAHFYGTATCTRFSKPTSIDILGSVKTRRHHVSDCQRSHVFERSPCRTSPRLHLEKTFGRFGSRPRIR